MSILTFSFYRAGKGIKECIEDFKGQKECVILGNGPSINELFESQYDLLFDKDVFVVNYFCLTDYFENIKPKFYTLMDPGVFEMNFSEEYGDLPSKLLKCLNKIDWDMVLFIPSQFSKSKLVKLLTNKKIKIVKINSTPILPSFDVVDHALFNLNLGMPTSETVINAVIFIAINMQYDCIHLHGVEQSWLKDLSVNEKNEVNVGLPHFYKGPKKLLRHPSLKNLSTFLRSQATCFESHLRLENIQSIAG